MQVRGKLAAATRKDLVWGCTSSIRLSLELRPVGVACCLGMLNIGLVGELAPPDLTSPLAVRLCPCPYAPSSPLLCATVMSTGSGASFRGKDAGFLPTRVARCGFFCIALRFALCARIEMGDLGTRMLENEERGRVVWRRGVQLGLRI